MADMSQLLLNMMLGAQGGQSTRPFMEEMLNSDNDMDPTTRLLLTQALAGDNADEDEVEDDDEEDPDVIILDRNDYGPSRRQRAIDRLRQRFQRMNEQIEEMSEELDWLQARNDDLAEALGACYLCWGQNPECPECCGKGIPGSAPPDPKLYKKWVLPAVRAMQARQQRYLERNATFIQ